MKNLIQGVAMAEFPSSGSEPRLPLEPAPRRTRPRQRFRTALEARQWRRRMLGYAVVTLGLSEPKSHSHNIYYGK